MKRKVYSTRRERLIDQLLGFLVFPLVNVPLAIIVWILSQTIMLSDTSNPNWLLVLTSALPWLVNGIVIVLAFIFRPQFGVGYLAFIAITITLVGILGIAFVAACFVTLFVAFAFQGMSDQGVISLFVFLMTASVAAGLLGLGVIAYYVIKGLSSSHVDRPQ